MTITRSKRLAGPLHAVARFPTATKSRRLSPELSQQRWALRRLSEPEPADGPGETQTPVLVGWDTDSAECLYCGRPEQSAMGLIHHWERDCLAIKAIVLLAYEAPEAPFGAEEEPAISLSSWAS
jgi:hypothetical protein